jgi:hypothetical protein
LRTHLAQTFPDVASATVQKGTKKIDGVSYDTIEFVKKAGTKGALATDLSSLLAELPAIRIGTPPQATTDLVRAVHTAQITIDAALAQGALTAIQAMPRQDASQKGGVLCSLLDAISPVPADDVSAW